MASYKVAVFILLVAVLSRTAFSDEHSACLNGCDIDADICIDNCGTNSCGAECANTLSICYDECSKLAKREYYSTLPREPDQKPDDEGPYDIFHK